jgi:DNA helicase-2/ATP-dependent DNA helicase PcrA
VFVLNAADGCIPSDLGAGTSEDLEEERRLLYVALTRARDQLDVIVPQRFYTHQQARNGDRHVYASRTRFIPDSIVRLFDRRVWPAARAESAAAGVRTQAAVDVGARMRAMWKRG